MSTPPFRPDFSGVWILNVALSTLRGAIPQEIFVQSNHDEPHITQTIPFTSTDQSPQRMTFTFNTTGSESMNRLGRGVGHTKARWRDSVLVIESRLQTADRELYVQDHWLLSDDKKILTMAHHDDDLASQISILEASQSIWPFDQP